ncbi:hypothetical protein [Aeromicrobium wangtongii]|uniref:hypothetical protein n=1 Tax=Aeromicrobium wangtongii TaxID=2969247 RepID=UPI0020173F1C|nr:hypothetical protein [Aeromicrobium wangtongii]MCL3816895.1 hypothetical protein [Aeromicrobium wangtongii]
MSIYRWASVLTASLLVTAVAATDPARAATGPTRLAVDGTVRVVVIDRFGDHAHADHLYTVETDDGAMIPVDLPDGTPPGARFRGELVVEGEVADDLRSRGMLPGRGATIGEDTRAGRVAIASADEAEAPLRVVESAVVAAAVAPPAPSAHRAYVARMTDQGSVDGTDAAVGAAVDSMLGYWTTEAGGAITSFNRVGAIESFDSTADIPPSQSCGILTPEPIWDQAAKLWPKVNFFQPGNHLIVLVGDECGNEGPVGVATLGTSIADGGPSILTYDPSTFASTGVHEIGHNFGLEHANLAARDDYMNLYSPMGFSVGGGTFTPPALGTLYRRQLGLLGAAESPTAAASGAQSFTIAPRSAATGTRGVVVTDPLTGEIYSIDLRLGTERDETAFYSAGRRLIGLDQRYDHGVVVERLDSSRQTFLMAGSTQGSFGPGQVFAPSAGLRVSVTAVSPGSAAITVETAPAPPAPAPPAPGRLKAKTPKVTGTAKVGKTLKVKVGSWSPKPSFRYQWYAGGKKITSKGTKASLKLTARQKGKKITVRVTARKTGYTTVSKTSKATKKVARK